MRNFTVGFLCLSLLSLSACKNSAQVVVSEADAVSTPTPMPISGDWLSDCYDFSGVGTGYARVYAAITSSGEDLASLNYGTDTTCSSAYTITDIGGNPAAGPVPTFTISSLTSLSGSPTGYYAVVLPAVDNSFTMLSNFLYAKF